MTEPTSGATNSSWRSERVQKLENSVKQSPGYEPARAVEAWFIGPRGENADEFERLVVEAVRDHIFWRRNFHPEDPSHITEEIKASPEFHRAMGQLKEHFRGLLAALKKSSPFFSMRYQGHMNWELTMPSLLGYFAAMLYNPNNVAFEASTTTTLLEMLVGDELCQMLGYPISEDENAIRPWGHITADGTIANIEALWAIRNLKFLPVTLRAGLKEEAGLGAAKDIEIPTPDGGSARLADADTWTLMNLTTDDVLALPDRFVEEFGVDRDAVTSAIVAHSLQQVGIENFASKYLSDLEQWPVFLVTGTKHYSWPKAAGVLGIGASSLVNIPVDIEGRMDVGELEKLIEDYYSKRIPIYTVITVVGSTEESAIDPVADVLELRDRYRAKGMDFTVHTDAAWGGYHASMIRTPEEIGDPPSELAELPPSLSVFSQKHLAAMGQTDSITVDPHKSGYIPYPAGALCYRNGAMRSLVTVSAPVVFHGDDEPSVGIYGLEGSKPGAAAASVYLSHRVIRPSQSGYGQLIGQALFAAEKLYVRLLCMFDDNDPLFVVPLTPLSDVIPGNSMAEKMQFLRDRIDRPTRDKIFADEEVRGLLGELGPDLNILAYAFNFKDASGNVNTDLEKTNKLNRGIYDFLSIDPGDEIYGADLILSTTNLAAVDYGENFVQSYKDRLGVGSSPGKSITVLRSAVLDPWVTETPQGDFLDVLETEFRKAAHASLDALNGA